MIKVKKNTNDECRLCGSTQGLQYEIFDSKTDIVKKIHMLIPVVVKESDPFPKKLCHRCVVKITDFFKFREHCVKTDAVFKRRYSMDSNNFQNEPVSNSKDQKQKIEKPVENQKVEKNGPVNEQVIDSVVYNADVVSLEHPKNKSSEKNTKLVNNKNTGEAKVDVQNSKNVVKKEISCAKNREQSKKKSVGKGEGKLAKNNHASKGQLKDSNNVVKDEIKPVNSKNVFENKADIPGSTKTIEHTVLTTSMNTESPSNHEGKIDKSCSKRKVTKDKEGNNKNHKLNSTESALEPSSNKKAKVSEQIGPTNQPRKVKNTVIAKKKEQNQKSNIFSVVNGSGPEVLKNDTAYQSSIENAKSKLSQKIESDVKLQETAKSDNPHLIVTEIPGACSIYTCQLCEVTFVSDVAALSHKCRSDGNEDEDDGSSVEELSVSDDELYVCDICESAFTSYEEILEHRPVHQKEGESSETEDLKVAQIKKRAKKPISYSSSDDEVTVRK